MISLKNIEKTYSGGSGEVRALRGICLDIDEGEFIGIVGRSGSGKTTLMNILGCLDTPTRGEYKLRGHIISNVPPNIRAGIRNQEIGFIFQGYNLAPNLTALENVELPLMFRGISYSKRRKTAESALEAVGLYDRIRHFPSQLSGGQQQRVAIARAIAAKPPLILADEPTGSLDHKSAAECLDLLCDLNKSGHTVVLITHDPSSAAKASRIITITDGFIA